MRSDAFNRALNVSHSGFFFFVLKSKKQTARCREAIFYEYIAVWRSPPPPPQRVTAFTGNMLTQRLARHLSSFMFSLPAFLSSIARSLSLSLSFLALSPPPPLLPTFSLLLAGLAVSEVVAVCIAKGNVSSTHRKKKKKMGQNITMFPAHAQWLTQCWGYMHGVNQITVSSHIPRHA